MNRVIAVGDNMANNGVTDENSERFIDRLEDIWDRIEPILEAASDASFTGERFDDVIDKVLEIGDWILEGDDD